MKGLRLSIRIWRSALTYMQDVGSAALKLPLASQVAVNMEQWASPTTGRLQQMIAPAQRSLMRMQTSQHRRI